MRRIIPLALFACFVLVLAVTPAQAERRVALVIGNGSYATAPLKNSVNDARDMYAALKTLGFEATLLTDATMQQMETAVRDFGLKLRAGGMGLFYYAGHGVQVGGNNYLVPVKAVIQSESDVKYGCLDAGLVLGKMEDAGNGLNLVILDACRNNPFARSFRSAEQGLAKMDAPTGSLIAYATSPGKTAADGEGKNGLYTQHLLKNIATPGLSVEELFKRVRQGVAGDSAKKQVPWEASSLIGQFSFAGGEQTASLGQGAPVVYPPARAAAKPLDLKAEKKRVADEAAQLKREQDDLAQFQALQAEKAQLAEQRQKVEQAKLLALAPSPKQPPGIEAPIQAPVGTSGQTWADPATGMEFVWVPSGCFDMGSNNDEEKREPWEGPRHNVCVRGVWVGKYPVTQEQWLKIMESNPSHFKKGKSLPVENVSWNDAKLFIKRLAEKSGGAHHFRLPTEAEWEYACRAGASTAFSFGDTISTELANYDGAYTYRGSAPGKRLGMTVPVGSYKNNSFGLFDMHGNVWQWCEDLFDGGYYKKSPKSDPLNDSIGQSRVLRGGAWNSDPSHLRSAKRDWSSPALRRNNAGFRLVRID